MSHLDFAGLTRYDGKIKEYIGGFANWQKTAKAGAVTCWPVGGTSLAPVVDFLFTETGPAEGTKGPDNPSKITGVSSITVTHCESEGVDSTDYTIALGSTYYGGSFDLATGTMTVTWEGVVLDGTENWTDGALVGDGVYRYQLLNDYNDKYHPLENNNQACSHFDYIPQWSSASVHWFSNTPAGNAWFFTTAQTSIAGWKTWLADQKTGGTPVTFVAKATPYTVQLSPVSISALAQQDKYTPRLNTVYSDQTTVQVGYAKSPIQTEYELTQAILATEGGE